MRRTSAAAVCLLAAAILLSCSRNGPPNSLFDSAGYHVRDDKVYYLNAFPGKAFEINSADAATFKALDATYGRDKSSVYINGQPLAGADPASFALLDRPGFAKDRNQVYQRDRAISDDPAHFELLDGELAKDSHVVFWSDGSILSEDPTHFAIVSNADHYLYTKDDRTVHVNGNPIPAADPATFQVLQGAYARDNKHAFYFDQPITDADLTSLRPLAGPYAGDAVRVYWMGKTIDGANPRTFHVAEREFRMLCRRPARLLPAESHRRRRSADISARPGGHELLRDVNILRAVALTRDTPEACRSAPCRRRPCRPS